MGFSIAAELGALIDSDQCPTKRAPNSQQTKQNPELAQMKLQSRTGFAVDDEIFLHILNLIPGLSAE